jgi:hypothetical protein
MSKISPNKVIGESVRPTLASTAHIVQLPCMLSNMHVDNSMLNEKFIVNF